MNGGGPSPIFIEVPGLPVAWQRATPVMVGDYPVMKTPKRTRAYQDVIKQLAKIAMRSREPLAGPIRLTVTAYLPRSGAAEKEKRAHPFKQNTGDADNYSKTAQDALNGIVFVDDAQICELISRKRYGAPKLVIVIDQMRDGE